MVVEGAKSILYTEQAKKRITLVKAVADAVQYEMNAVHEDWRVFTSKEQKDSLDPCQFEICKVKTMMIFFIGEKIVSVKRLYSVTVDDEGLVIAVSVKQEPVLSVAEQELSVFLQKRKINTTINTKDWIIKTI